MLSIYKYQLEHTKIDLRICDDISVKGTDITLFQLWKHLILFCCKNYSSVEADQFLKINAIEMDECIQINFNIHGTSTNKEIINEIDKIQSIKDKLNPKINFKLGLIKKIITDHNGKLDIKASEENTIFKITLPI